MSLAPTSPGLTGTNGSNPAATSRNNVLTAGQFGPMPTATAPAAVPNAQSTKMAPVITAGPATENNTKISNAITNGKAAITTQASNIAQSVPGSPTSFTYNGKTYTNTPTGQVVKDNNATQNTSPTPTTQPQTNQSQIGFTGRMDYSDPKNPNGTFIAVDPKTGLDVQTDAGTTTGTTTNGTTASTGNATLDAYTKSVSDAQAKADQAYTDFSKVIEQYKTGTIPLTATQQSLVDSMTKLAQQAHEAQVLANKNYTGGTTTLQNTLGTARYAPDMAQGAILNAVNIGLNKLQELDARATQALAAMEQGFQDGNFKIAQTAYDAYSKYLNDREKTVKDTYDTVAAASKDARDFAATQAKDALALKNTLASQKSTLLTELGKVGTIPDSVAQQINDATDIASATALATPYLKDPLDTKYKLAQIAKLNADAAKAIASGNSSFSDPAEAIAFANQYAATGVRPTGLPKGSFGEVASLAKELPKSDGEVVDINSNVRPPKLSPTQVDALAAGQNIVTKVLPDLKNLFDSTYTGILPGVLSSIGIQSDNMTKYNSARTMFLNKLLLLNSGKVVSDSELQRYQNMIPGSYNDALFLFGANGDIQIDSLTSQLSDSLNANLKANNAALYGFSKVKVNGADRTVGEIITNGAGQSGKVLPDGSVQLIEE